DQRAGIANLRKWPCRVAVAAVLLAKEIVIERATDRAQDGANLLEPLACGMDAFAFGTALRTLEALHGHVHALADDPPHVGRRVFALVELECHRAGAISGSGV